MYKGPLDLKYLSACLGHVVFLFPFSPFSSNPLLHPPHPHPPAEGGYWWNNALFFSRFHIHEQDSKEKQKKSQKRSDYCCGKRVWVTSLSRRKDKQVINAAGRRQEKQRLRASSGFCSAPRNNTVQQPSQSGQTFAQIWASAQPLLMETKRRAQNYDAQASLRFGLLQITPEITINICQGLI